MRWLFLAGCVFSTLANASETQPRNASLGEFSRGSIELSTDFSFALNHDDWLGVYDVVFAAPWGDSALYGSIDGRTLIPLFDNVGIQVEGSSTREIDTSKDVASYSAARHVGAHLLYRNQSYQFGILGGVGNSIVDNDEEWRSSILGVEAQFYFDSSTLWLQLNQVRSYEPDYDYERYDPVQFRMGARYFVNPNMRLDLEGGYTTGRLYGSTLEDAFADTDAVHWRLGAEYRIGGYEAPVSLFSNYSGTYIFENNDNPIFVVGGEQHSILAGISIKFGQETLFAQDRHGLNTDMRFSALPVIDALYGVGAIPGP